MKTYLVPTIEKGKLKYVAVEGKNKAEALDSVRSFFPKRTTRKTGIIISSVHIDYCQTFEKIK